jgi:hypothetical protein
MKSNCINFSLEKLETGILNKIMRHRRRGGDVSSLYEGILNLVIRKTNNIDTNRFLSEVSKTVDVNQFINADDSVKTLMNTINGYVLLNLSGDPNINTITINGIIKDSVLNLVNSFASTSSIKIEQKPETTSTPVKETEVVSTDGGETGVSLKDNEVVDSEKETDYKYNKNIRHLTHKDIYNDAMFHPDECFLK